MATLTTPNGLRYPDGNEKVKDGRLAIEHLAEDLDTRLSKLVFSVPSTPYDTQVIWLVADATNGVLWNLRYRSGSTSPYKWEFLGGSSLIDEVNTNQVVTSATFADAGTVGPQLTVPVAGEYEIDFGARVGVNTPGGTATQLLSQVGVKIGSNAVAANDVVQVLQVPDSTTAGVNYAYQGHRKIKRTVDTAGVTVKLQYASDGTRSSIFSLRNLAIKPVRVG